MTNEQLIADWRPRLERSVTEIQAQAGALSRRQLEWSPEPGAWSVGQVLDHLAGTTEQYLPLIDEAIVRSEGRPPREWKPSLFGGWLERAIVSPRKMPAPGAFRPAHAASANPLERFVTSQRAIAGRMDRARAADLRTRTHSPALRIVPLNLGDALYLQVIHAERHLQQIRRIREHVNFPA